MQEILTKSINQVQQWVEQHQYKGYDPGDGLKSFLRPLTFGSLMGERLLIQLIWKSPINLRPVLGMRPMDSTKGRGFMAWGYLLRYKLSSSAEDLEKAIRCLDWLETNHDGGKVGYAWGNHFDFTTRGGRMIAHTPTVVWSGLIGQTFLEAFRVTGQTRYLDVAERICAWILQLPREVTSSGSCISYTPRSKTTVHNSNLLGAAMLAATWKLRPEKEYLQTAMEAVEFSCSRQRPDGSWWYGEDPKHHWVDNFHTAYNLDSIKRYIDSTGDEQFRPPLTRGYEYFKQTFFEPTGRPRYYHNQTFPIDIQCAAQAIDTFSLFASEDDSALQMARNVAQWTIRSMQDQDGHFYYRLYPMLKAKTPYFHWGQATMFKALAHLQWRSACELKGDPHQSKENTIPAMTLPVFTESKLSYVLITPARNEEALIENTIRAVIAQTSLPKAWVIVSDGSTDRTDAIVEGYVQRHPWIHLLRTPEHSRHHFAAKANAFKCGYEFLRDVEFDVVGNLDADITFEPDYFEFLLSKFSKEPKLGVAGTPFIENAQKPENHTYGHRFAQLEHVSGACQLFRQACFESVGGYQSIEGGAIDWVAVTTARMRGWKTQTFTEKVCFHHRAIGTAQSNKLRARFHYGRKAYYVGSHPLWALVRGVFQMRQRPVVLGGALFLLGYFWSSIKNTPRVVTPELCEFSRAEQLSRLKSLLPKGLKRA